MVDMVVVVLEEEGGKKIGRHDHDMDIMWMSKV
jgi:hypothetical protein